MEGPVILGCFAHPDDEQYGTSGALMRAAEAGARVHILCATRGQAGQISDPALATPETLGEVRERELRDALAILGLEPPILLDYEDGRLPEVDPGELRDAIVGEIRRLRPRVVITFERNGGYGHSDHIAMHHATVAAVRAAANPAHRSDLGDPHRADKLYFTGYPRSLMRAMNAMLAKYGFPPIDFGDVQTIPTEEIGTPDELVTTVVDARDLVARRLDAMRAHRTQFGEDGPWALATTEDALPLVGYDHFVRAIPAPAEDAALPDETSLLDGLW